MDDLDKKYYAIRDVAEFIGVSPTTIRYWEQEIPEIAPTRTPTGLRRYTPDDVETLRIIHYLVKMRGLKLEAAKQQLHANRKNISKRLKVIDDLMDVRAELETMLKTLAKRR